MEFPLYPVNGSELNVSVNHSFSNKENNLDRVIFRNTQGLSLKQPVIYRIHKRLFLRVSFTFFVLAKIALDFKLRLVMRGFLFTMLQASIFEDAVNERNSIKILIEVVVLCRDL